MLARTSINRTIFGPITSSDHATPHHYPRLSLLLPLSPREPRLPSTAVALDPSIISTPSSGYLPTKTDYYLASHLHKTITSPKIAKLITKNILITPLPLVTNTSK